MKSKLGGRRGDGRCDDDLVSHALLVHSLSCHTLLTLACLRASHYDGRAARGLRGPCADTMGLALGLRAPSSVKETPRSGRLAGAESPRAARGVRGDCGATPRGDEAAAPSPLPPHQLPCVPAAGTALPRNGGSEAPPEVRRGEAGARGLRKLVRGEPGGVGCMLPVPPADAAPSSAAATEMVTGGGTGLSSFGLSARGRVQRTMPSEECRTSGHRCGSLACDARSMPWWYVMLCYVMLCYVMLCYVMLCGSLACDARSMPWCAMPGPCRGVMVCYVMLCGSLACDARSMPWCVARCDVS
jgi:hypothetical protein